MIADCAICAGELLLYECRVGENHAYKWMWAGSGVKTTVPMHANRTNAPAEQKWRPE
jgi:hypothetical protein